MQMNTIQLNIDKYKSMLAELGVLKTENEELKKLIKEIEKWSFNEAIEIPEKIYSKMLTGKG